MKRIGEGIYIEITNEKVVISKSFSLWSNTILLIGCAVSIIYWKNIYLIFAIFTFTILGNLHRKYTQIDFKSKVLNQYSKVLFFKFFNVDYSFTDSVKFEIRREEFSDADMGLSYAYVLYFISDFEKDIFQFDFSNTAKKLISTFPVELK
jgi:hypothetical protein